MTARKVGVCRTSSAMTVCQSRRSAPSTPSSSSTTRSSRCSWANASPSSRHVCASFTTLSIVPSRFPPLLLVLWRALVLACVDSALAWADSDASMILHRNVYAVRDGVVVDVWEMDGSIGRTQ